MNRRLDSPSLRLFCRSLVLLATLAGCRDDAPDFATLIASTPPLRDRDAVVKHLPHGTTLGSPIIADRILGASAKTVEQALGRLQAIARDGTLYDGIGREIRFHSIGKAKSREKDPDKALARLRSKYCVVLLAE